MQSQLESVQGLLDDVCAAATAEGGTWFPEIGAGPLRVHYLGSVARSRCFLHRLDLEGATGSRPLMVKVRHSDPALRRSTAAGVRPVLSPVRTMGNRETARREFDGLVLIRDAVTGSDSADSRFGVVRPLAWLPEHAAIVTDFVQQPTLRTALLETSRLRPGKGGGLPDRPWANAGASLRLFHEHPAPLPLPPRMQKPADVARLVRGYTDFLRDRMGARPLLRDVGNAAEELARSALPADLPLATGHGDFVPNNMFVSGHGRITVFDPLPLWRTPVHQDLATVTVGLRVLWAQVMTGGLAIPRRDLDRYEAALYRGYWGEEAVPWAAMGVFELLVLLDRWSAVVSTRARPGGFRSQVRRTRVRMASHHYAHEVRRTLVRLGA